MVTVRVAFWAACCSCFACCCMIRLASFARMVGVPLCCACAYSSASTPWIVWMKGFFVPRFLSAFRNP